MRMITRRECERERERDYTQSTIGNKHYTFYMSYKNCALISLRPLKCSFDKHNSKWELYILPRNPV